MNTILRSIYAFILIPIVLWFRKRLSSYYTDKLLHIDLNKGNFYYKGNQILNVRHNIYAGTTIVLYMNLNGGFDMVEVDTADLAMVSWS